jgi:hypothetical protein
MTLLIIAGLFRRNAFGKGSSSLNFEGGEFKLAGRLGLVK